MSSPGLCVLQPFTRAKRSSPIDVSPFRERPKGKGSNVLAYVNWFTVIVSTIVFAALGGLWFTAIVQWDFREIFEIASAIANDATGTSALTASGPRAAPPYPPADEVTAMLRDADSVETDSQPSAWCRSRQLDAARIDDCDLAAVLRRSAP